MSAQTEERLLRAAKGVLAGSYYSYAALAAAVAAAEEEAWVAYCQAAEDVSETKKQA
jgi:hypothetical protein